MSVRAAFDLAVRNIARWGDTDVFPFPPENHVLHDKRDDVVDLLLQIHTDGPRALVDYPWLQDSALSLVSYEGFRWVTQLDPAWNAYLLGLVLSISDQLEASRIARAKSVVFSYRLAIDDDRASLFADGAWAEFAQQSAALATEFGFVVVCDIADFYSRVYHHRIKNALQLAAPNSDVPSRIELLLSEFSGGTSYGLPVGGPAARVSRSWRSIELTRSLMPTGSGLRAMPMTTGFLHRLRGRHSRLSSSYRKPYYDMRG